MKDNYLFKTILNLLNESRKWKKNGRKMRKRESVLFCICDNKTIE